MFKNISDYNNLDDYLSIFVASIFVYIISLIIIIIKNKINKNKEDSLNTSNSKYDLQDIVTDILFYVMSMIRIRYLYTLFVKYLPMLTVVNFNFLTNYSFIQFLLFGCIIQFLNDYLLFHFNLNPKSISDIFISKNANIDEESKLINKKFPIIITNNIMILLTIIISSYFGNFTNHTTINILINLIYILPYILHLIK